MKQKIDIDALSPEQLRILDALLDVTEKQAKKWLLAVIGDDQVKAYEDAVQNQINLSKAPTQGSGKPW